MVSSRYKAYDDTYKSYDLRVTRIEFNKILEKRELLLRRFDEVASSIENAKREYKELQARLRRELSESNSRVLRTR